MAVATTDLTGGATEPNWDGFRDVALIEAYIDLTGQAAGTVKLLHIPAKYWVLGVALEIITQGVATGTATMSIGDTSTPTKWLTTPSLKDAVGTLTASTATGLAYAAANEVQGVIAYGGGTLTAGKIRVYALVAQLTS